MTVLNDVQTAAEKALTAGMTAARNGGKGLAADLASQLKPNLLDIAAQIASITEARITGTITTELAQLNLKQQFESIRDLAVAEAELVLLAIQDILNAVIDALKAAVNTALKFPLVLIMFGLRATHCFHAGAVGQPVPVAIPAASPLLSPRFGGLCCLPGAVHRGMLVECGVACTSCSTPWSRGRRGRRQVATCAGHQAFSGSPPDNGASHTWSALASYAFGR